MNAKAYPLYSRDKIWELLEQTIPAAIVYVHESEILVSRTVSKQLAWYSAAHNPHVSMF